jgi:hypothetical protein
MEQKLHTGPRPGRNRLSVLEEFEIREQKDIRSYFVYNMEAKVL